MKFVIWILGIVLVAYGSRLAQAAVTVQTTDGRVITGEVDAETNNNQLWIRQQREQIVLTTAIAWSEVLSVSQDGKSLPNEQLAELLLPQATSQPPPPFIVQPARYESPAKRQHFKKPQVRSLAIEACLMNFDRDIEPDGIELLVAALDRDGLPVPVQGSLSARLWGERIQPHGSLVGYETLQRWSQRVVPDDFLDGSARYTMRFRTVEPALDLGLHSEALLHVRLGVVGQGNFAASAPVQIRWFNPPRDRLQLTRGSRYLPDELTHEVRHQLPFRTHSRQLRIR